MSTTKKRFDRAPLGMTGPTAEEPIPDPATSVRPDADPFKAPDVVAPKPRDAVKAESHDATVLKASDVEASIPNDVLPPGLLDSVKSVLSDADASAIHKLMTSRRREVKKEEKVAFTWRIALDQADQLDRWAMDLRRKLGRGRLDRSELLAAIVDEVSRRPDVMDAVASRLQNP